MELLRWHVARLHEHGERGRLPTPMLEVAVTVASRALHQEWPDGPPLGADAEEKLDWWRGDPESTLEGWLSGATLVRLVRTRGMREDRPTQPGRPEERKITEDMVFLQSVRSEKQLDTVWRKLKAAPGIPDLEPLAELRGSRWSDFTLLSRYGSHREYRNAMRRQRQMRMKQRREHRERGGRHEVE